MEKIKIKINYGQLNSFLEVYELTGWRSLNNTSRAIGSITQEIYLKLWSKEITLRTEKKDFTITLKYYQAWAVHLFLCSVLSSQVLTDEYTKNCIHKLRDDIDQKL